MASAVEVGKYSLGFEEVMAEYCTGQESDRGPLTTHETYTKLQDAKQFLQFCERYRPMQGCRFLEVGTGSGTLSVAASLLGATVAGTDFADKALRITQARWNEHSLEGDLFSADLRLPVADHRLAAYDFVSCFQVLEHVPRADQFKAMANLFSFVAPGGYLFIDTENSLAPFDRHDTHTWLLRYLSKPVYEQILAKLGLGLNHFEVSTGGYVQTHDYLSYDELVGAAQVSGFEVVSPFMPHGDKKQYLRVLTGSDWLHDSVLQNVDVERFAPISLLLKKSGAPPRA